MTGTTRALVVTAAILMIAAPAVAQKLDEGLLDPAWYGEDLDWRETDDIDYLWVGEGFDLDGRTLEIADWEQPEFLHKKDRDAKDSARAYELTDRMPGLLRGAVSASVGSGTEVTAEGGDIVLVGRFVDVNAGSRVAKWVVGLGAGSATATWDLKFVDAESGEILAAVHHRAISGTNMSDIDDKIVKWLDEAFGAALQKGLGTVYASGKPPKK